MTRFGYQSGKLKNSPAFCHVLSVTEACRIAGDCLTAKEADLSLSPCDASVAQQWEQLDLRKTSVAGAGAWREPPTFPLKRMVNTLKHW